METLLLLLRGVKQGMECREGIGLADIEWHHTFRQEGCLQLQIQFVKKEGNLSWIDMESLQLAHLLH